MVESSSFGAEFYALLFTIELIVSLRYRLRMIGVPIVGEDCFPCDNESVYKTFLFSEYQLKKNHQDIYFH